MYTPWIESTKVLRFCVFLLLINRFTPIIQVDFTHLTGAGTIATIIVGIGSASERRRYFVTSPLFGWSYTHIESRN